MIRELPEKLNAKQRKFIKEFESLGIGPADTDFWEVWDSEGLAAGLPVSEQRGTIIREAETVLLSLYRPNTVGEVECKNCKRKFLTNYRYNKHCSEDCLRQSLESMGIKWDPDKPIEERWQGEPPGTIIPETMDVLKDWAQNVLNYYTNQVPWKLTNDPVWFAEESHEDTPWKVHSSTFVLGNISQMYEECLEEPILEEESIEEIEYDLSNIDSGYVVISNVPPIKKQTKSLLADLDLPEIDVEIDLT